jgi:NitT/TauT family transport system substrate-binding protein
MLMNIVRQQSSKRRLSFVRLWIFFLAFVVCNVYTPSATAVHPPKKVTLIPLWSPQAQFAGYYVALDKGFYARHGIDLTILKGGAGHSPAESLQSGQADFAVLWLTTALQHHATGTKLVNVSQIIQRSSMMLISRKSSGIRAVEDMSGKKVGLWGGDLSIPPRALFAKHGIHVREVPLSHTVNLFLRGGIDVTSAMWYNEYHVILNAGVDAEQLNAMFLSDQGMNFPEDGLYALEKTVKNDPVLVDAFASASLEGWQYAFAHPEEALDIVVKYMHQAQVPANRIHQKWMLDRMHDLVIPGKGKGALGRLNRLDYEAVGDAMRREGLIRNYPDYTAFTRGDNARP